MKRYVVWAAALPLFASGGVAAAPAITTSIQITHAWIRWLPENLPAAGYLVIANRGDRALRLIGATSPDYSSVMLHLSREVNGMDKMSMVSGIGVAAHGHTALAPGGYHLMLSGAKRAIKPGDHVQVILHFADGQSVQADFPVRPANASGP